MSCAFDQICALPPSTNSSIPVTKLESPDARNNAALAISSDSPMRPIGMVNTIRAIASLGCPSIAGASVGPGLRTFDLTEKQHVKRDFVPEMKVSNDVPSASLRSWFGPARLCSAHLYTMMKLGQGCRNIELFSSLPDNMHMGRPKNFSRAEVLEMAMPIFWRRGFFDTRFRRNEGKPK
jgi:hypothetical protein